MAYAVVPLSGCGKDTPTPQTPTAASVSPASADALPTNGIRAFVDLPEKDRTEHWNDRLHFCVFENGSDDWIYVGVKYGYWGSGEFDLRSGDRLAFTGRVPALLYGGTLLRMGDTIPGGSDHSSLRITRVAGTLK